MSDFINLTANKFVSVHEKETNMIIAPKVEKLNNNTFYDINKRSFDIIVAVIALVILIIPMMLIAVAIVIDSDGPAIYKQERLGKNEKKFYVYKFRSMHLNAENSGAQWASEDDIRVTRIGRFIRKTRIDELPQLWNIVKGEMSFVGPRPERPMFYDMFDTYIDGFRQRMYVVPGLTGWAQVNGGYNLKPEEKIIYDVEYINNRSFSFDFKCILRTFSVVFKGDGAR